MRIGTMNFWLSDDRDNPYNESVDCSFALYGEEKDEALPIDKYYDLCRQFAAAMGFGEDTIERCFGRY